MGNCPKCGTIVLPEEGRFCSGCGQAVEPAITVPGTSQEAALESCPQEDGRKAKYLEEVAKSASDGAIDLNDRETLEETRVQLGISGPEAAELEVQAIDGLRAEPGILERTPPCPIALEINDNHFHMEKKAGVLDLRIVNQIDKVVSKVCVAAKCNYLEVKDDLQFDLRSRGEVRRKVQVFPSVAGELVVDLTVSFLLDGQPCVFTAQPMLKVLMHDETPASLTVVIDQRMQAGRNIGYGMSVRNEVKEGVAKGIIQTANDLLQQKFADCWEQVGLVYDEEMTARLREGIQPETRILAQFKDCVDAGLNKASLDFPNSPHSGRILLLAAPEISMGRNKGDNDIVLRVLPRSAFNDPLSLQISKKHLVLSLRSNGLFLTDLESSLGTTLNGEPLTGQRPIPLDQPSEIQVGKALRLRLIPFLETGKDQDDLDRQRYKSLGEPDQLWEKAAGLKLRSVSIQRQGNLANEEQYLLIYRWANLGRGVGNEILLPGNCPDRRCMRILRRGGKLWLEGLAERQCLQAETTTFPRNFACPIYAGLTAGCGEMAIKLTPFEQLMAF